MSEFEMHPSGHWSLTGDANEAVRVLQEQAKQIQHLKAAYEFDIGFRDNRIRALRRALNTAEATVEELRTLPDLARVPDFYNYSLDLYKEMHLGERKLEAGVSKHATIQFFKQAFEEAGSPTTRDVLHLMLYHQLLESDRRSRYSEWGIEGQIARAEARIALAMVEKLQAALESVLNEAFDGQHTYLVDHRTCEAAHQVLIASQLTYPAQAEAGQHGEGE